MEWLEKEKLFISSTEPIYYFLNKNVNVLCPGVYYAYYDKFVVSAKILTIDKCILRRIHF